MYFERTHFFFFVLITGRRDRCDTFFVIKIIRITANRSSKALAAQRSDILLIKQFHSNHHSGAQWWIKVVYMLMPASNGWFVFEI